jgi:hypothetical protein
VNKVHTSLIGAAVLVATLPVSAGPDWQVIEEARKNHSAAQAQRGALRSALPLDHGPRAQTTQYLNEKRKDLAEVQASRDVGATQR